MKQDLFTWSVGTAVLTTILVFVLGLLSTNDLYFFVLIGIIAILSIITFAKKFPKLSSFRSAGVLGIVTTVSMLLVADSNGRIESLLPLVLMIIVSYFVAGYIGKLVKK